MIITSGKLKGQKITAPDENITRPTLSKVRMAVFNTLQSMINFQDASFLDMYAGSGIMGLEAFSRGFLDVTFVEKNRKVADVLKKNIEKIGAESEIIIGDSLKIAPTLNDFDVIYIDPPYYAGIYEDSLKAVRGKGRIIILEHRSPVDFEGFELIKQKKYGDKLVTFLENKKG